MKVDASQPASVRLQRIEALYHQMLALPPQHRAAALATACSDEPALAAEVQALLEQPDSADGPLRTPALHAAAGLLSDPHSSLAGRRLGVFEVRELLGVGGMGEVYRARDSRLGRDVAIKILQPAFAIDPERLARFEREARVLASLNHPNIGALYGLEEADEHRGLVLELVEGETLSERIGSAGLPVPEALTIAKQIADALDAAHEKGIVHRDLKPGNIMITPSGAVKVLDFGLAKLARERGDDSDLSKLPTAADRPTDDGAVLGTAAYMSPEQARGKAVDKRTDVWGFGCVLYEMLTGRAAFARETVSDTNAAILEHDADWSLLPKSTPPSVARLLRRCLEKDAKRRLRDIGDAALELAETGPAGPNIPDAGRSWQRPALAAVAAAALIVALAARARWQAAPLPLEVRTDITTPGATDATSFALSPDGRSLVYEGLGEGGSRLWLRSLTTTAVRPLAGTEGGKCPFWSPDSRSIGFFAANALKRLDLADGATLNLAPVVWGRGGTWSADGLIAFSPNFSTEIRRVSAIGGASAAATALGPGQRGHYGPQFLPDGRNLLFFSLGALDAGGIFLGPLDGGRPTRLTSADGPGTYLPSGWLLWVRSGTLVAQRLDVRGASLTGEPVTLADGVVGELWRTAVSVATTGFIAYRASAGVQRRLTWFDRSGTARGTVGDPDSTLLDPRVSSTGRRVAMIREVHGRGKVWLSDGARLSRFTFDPESAERYPIWSPDGTRIVFRSDRRVTGADLYQKPTDGGVEELLHASDQAKSPNSWSMDGRFLLFTNFDPDTGPDLWVLPMFGDRTPSPFLKTRFLERQGSLSRDGRWVAYVSNESGRDEVYARPFSPPTANNKGATALAQWQISTQGGISPTWRRDGREIYFLNPAGEMMAAPVAVSDSALDPGAPVTLFGTNIVGGGVINGLGRQYDIAPDGRFLINTVLFNPATAPITLVQNWNPEVKR